MLNSIGCSGNKKRETTLCILSKYNSCTPEKPPPCTHTHLQLDAIDISSFLSLDSRRTLDWAKVNARSWWIQTSTLAQIKSALRLWSSTIAGSKVITHHVHTLHSLTHSFPPLSCALPRPSMQNKAKREKGQYPRCVTPSSSTVLMQLDGKFDCTTMAKLGEFIIPFGCVCIVDLCAVWHALQFSLSLAHTYTHTHTLSLRTRR